MPLPRQLLPSWYDWTMPPGSSLRKLLLRLDEAVLRGKGRDVAPGLEYGFAGRAGIRAEEVAGEVAVLRERVAALEARLAALESK